MIRLIDLRAIFFLLLAIQLEQLSPRKRGVLFSEARMEAQFEKCCGLGASWAMEGLRCEKFTGPVSGVPTVEQGLCLEAVDICCVRAYHEQQCKKGKLDAHAGLACVSDTKRRRSGPGDYHRDCCEACKLGILTGSMGQGCAFKKFTFGNPWDPAFLECCYEASPSTTTTLTTDLTNATSAETTDTESTSSSSSSSSTSSSDSTSFSPSIPTPPLDDICQLMKGLLCSDICIPTPGSYYCKCRKGFTLLEDGKTCRQDLPTDRCKSSNPCEQRCTDNGVAVTCSCDPGYVLANDKRSCMPKSPESRSNIPDEEEDFSSLCPQGYRYNATNQVCDDVNECMEKGLCPGRCENTIGSYTCMSKDRLKTVPYEDCPPGYQWELATGLCADIDECLILPKPCPADKNFCVNTQGSFSCLEMKGVKSCPAGFKFNKLLEQCEDVNECEEKIHSCSEATEECRNTEGAYECDVKCKQGFAYDVNLGTCIDVDECVKLSNPCPNSNTSCKNIVGSYECLSLNHSLSSGRFRIEKETTSLNCPAGFKPMKDIEEACIDVDECKEQLHSCEENEQCINDIGSYRCEVKQENANITGKQENTQTYSYRTTHRYETSMSPIVNQSMICEEGFIFDHRSSDCIDIDECSNDLSNCTTGEQCINFEGGYRCSPVCPSGFQVLNNSYHARRKEELCQDINECALGLHSCNISTHYCVNTNGSYTCEAFSTTTISSTAINRPLGTHRNHKMQNMNHYLILEPCKHGYTRDLQSGECVDIDECATGTGCRDHEQCHNTLGSFECSPLCTTGWYFNTATKGCQDVDECLLGRHDCPQGTHKCVNINGSFLCELILPCSSGYKRSFNGSCIDIDECLENMHTCQLELHQYCVNKNGSFECLTRLPSCQAGYEYSLATKRCEDIDECVTGQYKCDSRLLEKCVNLPGSYRCERPASYGQRQRQKPACPSGFRYHPRLRKCTDIDECAEGLDTCEGEVCYNQPGGYSCAKLLKPLTRRPPTTTTTMPPNQKCFPGMKLVKNRCVDINECREIEDACTSDEECINTMGSYKCECKIGFRRENLTQACVDINECQTLEDNCSHGQRCDNTIGSYTCTRYLSCGTGYTLNAATEICEDDDECLLGTHDCGGGYHCRNTFGSYRCDRNPRIPVAQPHFATTVTPTTTTTNKPKTTSVSTTLPTSQEPFNCPHGFEPFPGGKCVDIDECQNNPNICGRTMRCINTLGSYRCISKVICANGYTLDPISGQYCIDIDECANGTHECTPDQTCENKLGGYACICPAGHVAGPNKDCVDIDECSLYGNVCGSNSQCENTVGSFRCNCENGFENAGGFSGCQDIDECQRTPGLCQHMCFNTWGSYKCSCKPGFRLNSDNRSCTDVDECTEFKDKHLCVGICENTPGSYACKCPDGYKLGLNSRTCEDIDECQAGPICRGPDEICHNTRGGYRCNKISCPSGYRRDPEKKNRCVKLWPCINDLTCYRQPAHYSYNFITLVSMLPIASNRPEELFKMKGYHRPGSMMQFNMAFLEARAPPGVQRATESCFALKRPEPSEAVLVMTRSIAGPQEIELDLTMEVYHNTIFAGSAVAKILIFVSQYEF
ncbi:PREDICTED: fibrillin-3-like [Eufriesea mexicana]|uniref:fibrillin-3-like n=1 Tax=Eufriesea mexicana TaxID=516756 RepID=UPI00083BBA0E|nr:PREDICTED: fibrillin-3-like [Eufriesea mexicana]